MDRHAFIQEPALLYGNSREPLAGWTQGDVFILIQSWNGDAPTSFCLAARVTASSRMMPMACVLCRLLPPAFKRWMLPSFTLQLGPSVKVWLSIWSLLIKSVKPHSAKKIAGLFSIFNFYSTSADCKSADSLNRNKPKDLDLYMFKIQPLHFILYNPKYGYFLNDSLVLTSRLQWQTGGRSLQQTTWEQV